MAEERGQNHIPKMRRTSALISLTTGSALSKRIAYSRESVRAPSMPVKLPPAQPVRPITLELKEQHQVPLEKATSYKLPRLVNPDSSMAKRFAYSIKKKNKSDPLSEEMRSYFTNASMIDTWLMHRVMKDMRERPASLMEDSESPMSPLDNSYGTDPTSTLSRRIAYSLKPKGERDALLPETRMYFLYKSQLQTWGEERIVRAIYSWMNRKYCGPSQLTHFLKPTRRFITSLLRLMPPEQRSLERLLRLVEEQWIRPRYTHYYQFMALEEQQQSKPRAPEAILTAVMWRWAGTCANWTISYSEFLLRMLMLQLSNATKNYRFFILWLFSLIN